MSSDGKGPPVRRPVDPAFALGESGPAPGPRIVRGAALHGARHAADRAIAVLDQGVARQFIMIDVIFDVRGSETGKRLDFEAAVDHFKCRYVGAQTAMKTLPA